MATVPALNPSVAERDAERPSIVGALSGMEFVAEGVAERLNEVMQ
jgi:hypothetical protein